MLGRFRSPPIHMGVVGFACISYDKSTTNAINVNNIAVRIGIANALELISIL